MKRLIVMSLGLFLAFSLLACSQPTVPDITVTEANVRPPLPGQTTAMGTLKIVNKGAADVLLSVNSPISPRVELHTHIMEDGGVMKMRRVESFEIESKGQLVLKSGGNHIMLFDAEMPQSGLVNLTLNFQTLGPVTVQAKVKSLAPMDHSGH